MCVDGTFYYLLIKYYVWVGELLYYAVFTVECVKELGVCGVVNVLFVFFANVFLVAL